MNTYGKHTMYLPLLQVLHVYWFK